MTDHHTQPAGPDPDPPPTGPDRSAARPARTAEPAARLYDVRYSRYAGERLPRRHSVLALARSSAGRALGLRRTAGAKVWPFLLVAAAYLPVVVAVGVPLLFLDGVEPRELLGYAQLLSVLVPVTIAFAATTLPSLLTRERRDRVLSLYFSTSVSPAEYVAGKVLAALALVSLVSLGPLLVLLAGSIVTAEAPLRQLGDDVGDLPAVLLAGLLVMVHLTALGLTAGALTAKRVFAVGGLLAVLLVTPVLTGLLRAITGRTDVAALDLAVLPVRLAATVLPGPAFEPDPPSAGLLWAVLAGVVLIAAAVLAVTYRREDGA